MDKQQKIIALSLGALLLVLIVAVIVTAVLQSRPIKGDFTAPSFDPHAIEGIPPETQVSNYGKMTVSEGFAFCACAAAAMDDQGVKLYFTSPDTNTVWMKIVVRDAKGKLLGESGLIRPGEYLPSVALSERPSNKASTLYAQVYSYEPDTYYSKGSAGFEFKLLAE